MNDAYEVKPLYNRYGRKTEMLKELFPAATSDRFTALRGIASPPSVLHGVHLFEDRPGGFVVITNTPASSRGALPSYGDTIEDDASVTWYGQQVSTTADVLFRRFQNNEPVYVLLLNTRDTYGSYASLGAVRNMTLVSSQNRDTRTPARYKLEFSNSYDVVSTWYSVIGCTISNE